MDARTDLKTLSESKKSRPLKTPLRVSFKQLSVIGLVCVAAIASCSYGYYWWTVRNVSTILRQSCLVFRLEW